jgi:hypothetical protein
MFREYWLAGATPRYWWFSSALMLAYLGAIHLATNLAPLAHPPIVRAALALSPVLPVVGFVWLEYQRILGTDELRQRMELEAAMVALAIGVPVLLTLGLLDDAGLVRVPSLLATPALLLVYLLAQVWAQRRYR